MRIQFWMSLVAATIAVPAAAWAGSRMQPGLWEVTASVEMPDGTAVAPTRQTECLSQKDVDADPVPAIDQTACRATDIRRSGDKVTWKVDCGAIGKGEGEVVYRSPTSYEGWMKLDAGGTVLRTTISAKRVGACDAH